MSVGLPERHVVTCFLECQGRILLLKRSQRVGSFRGRWAAVSGYIETNPDEQSLIEIKEETGMSGRDVHLIRKGEALAAEDEGYLWVVHPYLFRINDKSKIKTDWEHCDLRWINPDRLGEYETVPMLREALARVYP